MELNKIYNEDCLIGMQEIESKSIDMILTDLPYGITANEWDSIIPLDKLWEQYERIIKDNGAIVLTATQPFASKLVMSNITLKQGDCLDLMKELPDESIDAVITDPPYFVLKKQEWDKVMDMILPNVIGVLFTPTKDLKKIKLKKVDKNGR